MEYNKLQAQFIDEIKQIVQQARKQAYSAINSAMVEAYWKLGKRIVEEEQQGQVRADYGKQLLKSLSKVLTEEFGKGFSVGSLYYYRQFYLTFPEIFATPWRILSWSHYKRLMQVSDAKARVWYLKEAAEHIKSADHVEIFGSGGSFIIGQDIKHKFLKIGIRCSVISDIDMQSMSASLLKKGDVVIGISHSGGTKSIFHCLDIAKKNGAFIILLTATAKSPMSRLADIVIPVISKETLFKSESNAARIAELVIMDVILAILVSDNNYKNYDKKIHATRMSTSENKF